MFKFKPTIEWFKRALRTEEPGVIGGALPPPPQTQDNNRLTREQFLALECKHEEAYTRSRYVGDTFMGAVTFCRMCEKGFVWPKEEK